MDNKYYIYKLVCDDINNFVYVNFTRNPSQKKRYYKDNTYLTYKTHKNESLYKTIREYGGWSNWRFILIDEIKCNKYQIQSICEDYRKKELYSIKHILEYTHSTIDKLQENNTDNCKNEIYKQENTKKHKKKHEDSKNLELLDKKDLSQKKIKQNNNIKEIVQKPETTIKEIQNNNIKEIVQKPENTIKEIQNNNIKEIKPENTIKEIQNNDNIIENTIKETKNDDKKLDLDLGKNISINQLSKYHKELANELSLLKMYNSNLKKNNKMDSIKSNNKIKNTKTLKYRKINTSL